MCKFRCNRECVAAEKPKNIVLTYGKLEYNLIVKNTLGQVVYNFNLPSKDSDISKFRNFHSTLTLTSLQLMPKIKLLAIQATTLEMLMLFFGINVF